MPSIATIGICTALWLAIAWLVGSTGSTMCYTILKGLARWKGIAICRTVLNGFASVLDNVGTIHA